MHYCMSYFCTKKRKQNILHKHSQISIYLFTHFYFFHFISTQFIDFAFIKIQMEITFTKSFNVLYNTIWSMLQTKFWLCNNFIKFLLPKIFPSLSEYSLRIYETDNCGWDVLELFLLNKQIIWNDSPLNICLIFLLQ